MAARSLHLSNSSQPQPHPRYAQLAGKLRAAGVNIADDDFHGRSATGASRNVGRRIDEASNLPPQIIVTSVLCAHRPGASGAAEQDREKLAKVIFWPHNQSPIPVWLTVKVKACTPCFAKGDHYG